jgi:hypothetical protein
MIFLSMGGKLSIFETIKMETPLQTPLTHEPWLQDIWKTGWYSRDREVG